MCVNPSQLLKTIHRWTERVKDEGHVQEDTYCLKNRIKSQRIQHGFDRIQGTALTPAGYSGYLFLINGHRLYQQKILWLFLVKITDKFQFNQKENRGVGKRSVSFGRKGERSG